MEVFSVPEIVYVTLSHLSSYNRSQLVTVSKAWHGVLEYIGSLEPTDIDEQIKSAAYYSYIKNKRAAEYIKQKYANVEIFDRWFPQYSKYGEILISQDPNMIELVFRQLGFDINHMLEIVKWNKVQRSNKVLQYFTSVVHEYQLCHPTTGLDCLEVTSDIKDLVIGNDWYFDPYRDDPTIDKASASNTWKTIATRIKKSNDIDQSLFESLDKSLLEQTLDFKEYTWTQISNDSRDHIRYTNKHIRDRYG